MDPEKIIDKIWNKISDFQADNRGAGPFCIVLDPHTIHNLDQYFAGRHSMLASEWKFKKGGFLFDIKIYRPRRWNMSEGQIIKVM